MKDASGFHMSLPTIEVHNSKECGGKKNIPKSRTASPRGEKEQRMLHTNLQGFFTFLSFLVYKIDPLDLMLQE